MAKALFFVLAAVLIVAVMADYGFDDETAAELEMIKRDSETLEYFMTEKRGLGKNMKKYKQCQNYNMQCWCGRRSGKIVFCNGAGTGDDI